MADEIAAKSRGPKFSAVESELLLVCIEQYRSVIECKRTDGVTAKAKDEAWQMVSGTFNALPNVSCRTSKQLRLWWDNQKKRARSRLADNKVELVKTGGGPPPGKLTDWDERVAAMTSSTFQPLQNLFDSDAAYHQLSFQDSSCQQLVPVTSTTGGIQQLAPSTSGQQLVPCTSAMGGTQQPVPRMTSFQQLVPATNTVLQLVPGTSATGGIQQLATLTSVQQVVPATNTVQQLVPNTAVTGGAEQPAGTSATKVFEMSSSSRSWAGRRRPYQQQKPTQSAKSASIAASTKITECSAARCELANLQMETEKERKQNAAAEHKLRMELMLEEQKWKLEEHQLKMELMKAELSRHAAEP